MKKIRWSTLSNTEEETSANRVTIRGEPDKDLKVSIIDKNDDKPTEITRYVDLKMDQHKVLITPKFQWKADNYQDTSSNNIEYTIKRADNYWKVGKKKEKLIINPGKRAEFGKARKEMHKNLLKDYFGDRIDDSKRDVGEETDMKYIILEDGKGNYKVKIYWGDKNDDKVFLWEQVEIEPDYWQNKAVDFDNLFNVEYQEEEKNSQWTTGWVVFFVVLTIVVVLITVFWKKIWKWIKGEREQEKKVKEQLDIF